MVEPEREIPLPLTLYLGMDGTGLPMRASEMQAIRRFLLNPVFRA